MRPPLSRVQNLLAQTSQCQRLTARTTKRTLTQTTRLRNQPQVPHYEPPAPKDSKGNDARLSRFSKILGISIGCVVAFGYSTYKYKKAKAAGTAGAGSEAGEDGFVKYRLSHREDVSSTCSIFTLHPAVTGSKGIDLDSQETTDSALSIRSVLFKQPQLQIARAYTLLPPTPTQDASELRFLIRKEHNGEVSTYLHRLQQGAEIELRGPSAEYTLPASERVRKVVFIAGGTGIAPALQVAKAVDGQADMHILWANRRREDCEGGKSDTLSAGSSSWSEMFAGWFSPFGTPAKDASAQTTALEARPKSDIVRRLEAVKRSGQGRVAIDYFVDDEGSFIRPVDATTLFRASFSPEAETQTGGKNLLFVSGPEGFVSSWAGPKEWKGGLETQGAVGGVLGKLDLRDWEVVKL
ncbi:hypothetical protein Q7P37_002436 [Cladosporium fusiforme]